MTDPAAVVLEMVMQCHLPVSLPDGRVMCLCYAGGDEIFEGPVFHRRHVARLQIETLRSANLAPTLDAVMHPPLDP